MASAQPQFSFNPFSPVTDRQVLRTRRFYLGTLAYAVGIVLLCLAAMVDLLLPAGLLASVSLIVVWNVVLYWLFHSGTNQRFQDKSLTQLQTLVGIALIMFVAYQFQRDRSLVLVWCLVVLLFGIFRFKPREFVNSTLFMLAGYALVINLLMAFRPQSVDVYLEWYQWAWLALIRGLTLNRAPCLASQPCMPGREPVPCVLRGGCGSTGTLMTSVRSWPHMMQCRMSRRM